jgi:hypothetical protein
MLILEGSVVERVAHWFADLEIQIQIPMVCFYSWHNIIRQSFLPVVNFVKRPKSTGWNRCPKSFWLSFNKYHVVGGAKLNDELTISFPTVTHVHNHVVYDGAGVDDGRGRYHVIVRVSGKCESVTHVGRLLCWNWRWRKTKRQLNNICRSNDQPNMHNVQQDVGNRSYTKIHIGKQLFYCDGVLWDLARHASFSMYIRESGFDCQAFKDRLV